MAQVKKKKKKQTEAQRLAHRDAVIAHADNKFVAGLTEKMDAFIYTKDFYIALYKQLEKGMTAVEAYESLGFDTKTLGKDCAQSAAKRARQKARNGEFEPKSDNFDGSVPIKEGLTSNLVTLLLFFFLSLTRITTRFSNPLSE